MHRLLILTLFVLCFCSFARPSNIKKEAIAKSTYTVDNETDEDMGTVTLVTASDSTNLSVGADGYYYASVSSLVTSVIISSQAVALQGSGVVTMPDDSKVKIESKGSSEVDLSIDIADSRNR